jgi:Carboxypeptidase regulatory-like domain
MRTVVLSLALGGLVTVPAFAQNQAAIVQGTVRDTAGQALGDVQVWIRPADVKARTDSVGHYRLEAVPAGAGVVSTALMGYASSAETVVLSPGDSITLDFKVVPRRLPDERPIMITPSVPPDSR